MLSALEYAQGQTDVQINLTIIGKLASNDRSWFDALISKYIKSVKIKVRKKVPQLELIEYYNSSDLLIFPSFFEGSPRVIKEALCCGCRVICSDIPGTRVLDPDFTTLIGFKPGDKEDLSRRVLEEINKKDNPERIARLVKLGQSFSVEQIASERVAFYNNLGKN